MIKKVTGQGNFQLLAKLLNDSFATIAREFGLTKENSPTNNAFITAEELESQLTENREFYYFEDDNEIVGFIAIEKSERNVNTFYIEKVAVHPHFRHKSIGRQLMDFSMQRIMELGGKRISIGLIDSNLILKDWYRQQGFKEYDVKSYDHLPFDVCMMEKMVSFNLHDKKFVNVENTTNGEVSNNTIFHYYQQDELIYADYSGGNIIMGHLIGRYIQCNMITFTYHHINENQEIRIGKCESSIEYLFDGRMRLKENWQWLDNDRSYGQSILEEIDT